MEKVNGEGNLGNDDGSNMREKKRKITTRDDEQRKEREGTIDEQELKIQFCILNPRQLMKRRAGGSYAPHRSPITQGS
jgi:hypothetical protein